MNGTRRSQAIRIRAPDKRFRMTNFKVTLLHEYMKMYCISLIYIKWQQILFSFLDKYVFPQKWLCVRWSIATATDANVDAVTNITDAWQ